MESGVRLQSEERDGDKKIHARNRESKGEIYRVKQSLETLGINRTRSPPSASDAKPTENMSKPKI